MNKQKFKLKPFETEDQASQYVAKQIFDLLVKKPDTKLGLATGSTPILTYQHLVKNLLQTNGYDPHQLENLKTFNLDEYIGISKEHPQSYHTFMDHNLFKKLPFIEKENIFFPKKDVNYDQLIHKMGGIDYQILGIGTNGHIGFNEPGSSKDSLTRVVDLAQSTIESNSRFFNSINEVPTKAVSMGLKTIMQAKKIVLLAFGSSKAETIAKLLQVTKFDINFPASILVEHPNVEIVVDKKAYNK